MGGVGLTTSFVLFGVDCIVTTRVSIKELRASSIVLRRRCLNERVKLLCRFELVGLHLQNNIRNVSIQQHTMKMIESF